VPKKAGYGEIRKSFRRLAHAYHPDKNPDNKIISAYFLEVQEAYQVLSNPLSRRVYDRERSLRGEGAATPKIVTAAGLAEEISRLNYQLLHAAAPDINLSILSAYLEFLLSENNLAVLMKEKKDSPETVAVLVLEALKASRTLTLERFRPLCHPLEILAEGNVRMLNLIEKVFKKKKQDWLLRKLMPWLVIILTILLCVAMYFY
jgi:hypothetical protein